MGGTGVVLGGVGGVRRRELDAGVAEVDAGVDVFDPWGRVDWDVCGWNAELDRC